MMKSCARFILFLISTLTFGSVVSQDAVAENVPPSAPATIAALPDFSAIVASHGKAVVNLLVLRDKQDSADEAGGDRSQGLPRYKSSVGSGFIISPDGLILTNRHVVDGADKITVKFINKLELPARVVGVDAPTDIAVLKVEAKNLPTVTLGDSDTLLVGQWVLAIGAPFGLERSASQGIISTLNRALPGDTYVPFIQTDVPINPGNSGGPLFDTQGRVVGINSQILSKSGGYMGLSFAIPINTAMAIANQIISKGKALHGWAGIATQDLNQDLARAFGLALPQGALVTEVAPGSPGDKGGLEPGDIILAVDSKALMNSADLPPLIGLSLPGESRALTVLRGKQIGQVNLVVGDLQDGMLAGKGDKASDRIGPLNIGVVQTDDATRKVLGITTGILVRELGPGPAAEAGILPGDILLRMGRQSLDTVDQFTRLIDQMPTGHPMPVMIKRRDGILFLPLTLPQDKPAQANS